MRFTPLMAAAAMALLAALPPLHAETDPASAAASAAELSPAYVKDLRELLEALRTYEWLAAPPSNAGSLTAADREFDTAFRRQVTLEETYRRLVPVYARFITPKQAAELAKAARSPAFRKREARGQAAGGATVYPSNFLKPAEMAELRRIDAMPAVIALRGMQKKIHVEVNDALGRWARQFDDGLADKAEQVLNKVSADLAAAREAGEGRTITIGRVSVPYMDKVVWISGSAIIKMSNAYRKFGNELKYYGFEDILKPEYLGSKVSLAHSRSVVEQVEASLEKLLKDIDQAIKERDEALRGVESPRMSNYLKKVEAATGGSYAYMIDFGEAYRRMLDEHRRVLSFISERQSKVHYEDGKLLFADDADLAMAREIYAKLDQASADLRALVARQLEKEEAAQHRRHTAEAAR
jgi:hypothetical protein